MQKDTKIIDNIMSVPKIKRRKLRSDAERFATKQCNGDYYFHEDNNDWEGPEANKAFPLQQSIIDRIHIFSNGIIGVITNHQTKENLPEFISFENDPRGFVLKIETGKLSDEAKRYCRDNRLACDWGGDYTILTDEEWK